MSKEHESFGMIHINRFTGLSQFFGSDLEHSGGISITINKADESRKYNSKWYHSKEEIIKIELSHNQFVDAITSGMNTEGVPCTIKHISGKRIEQINHIENKKETFSNDMKNTHLEYQNKINAILEKLEGNIGKRKASEIKHDLEVLKSHISSNTNFVMNCFNEAMEKTVTDAKHSISNYVEHKIHSLGIEGLKKELQISIEPTNTKELH